MIIIFLIAVAILFTVIFLLVGRIIQQENIIFTMNNSMQQLAETIREEPWYDEKSEARMNIIGQNGNEGTHYK
jgi:hypothetical protein